MKWAIVTGASSGIGKALALEFASNGLSVLLTGRNEAALNAVAAECLTKGEIETEVCVADLSCTDGIERLVEQIAARPLQYEVLVNNAGFGIHGDFASSDVGENVRLVNLQLTAALKLTKAVVPGMIERRNGKILNVASVYSF